MESLGTPVRWGPLKDRSCFPAWDGDEALATLKGRARPTLGRAKPADAQKPPSKDRVGCVFPGCWPEERAGDDLLETGVPQEALASMMYAIATLNDKLADAKKEAAETNEELADVRVELAALKLQAVKVDLVPKNKVDETRTESPTSTISTQRRDGTAARQTLASREAALSRSLLASGFEAAAVEM
jgi:hypothetical protein